MDTIGTRNDHQEKSQENFRNVAGYSAIVNPYLLVNTVTTGDYTKDDAISLEKLHSAGFSVSSLDEAWEQYQIAPIRSTEDCWKLLGYTNPPGSGKISRYRVEHLTALGIPYPDPTKPGETYGYTYYFRIRPARPVTIHKISTKIKYEQSLKNKSNSHSEPYFLMVKDQWTRIMNEEFPLVITEGELKSCALGLANVAAIGFPGCQMMYAPEKSGKNKLHHALDPDGPRSGHTIPIINRDITIITDSDYIDNKDVKNSFNNLIRNLITAGASPGRMRLVITPHSSNHTAKVGIDDYLTNILGPAWAGDREKVQQANSIIERLRRDGENINTNDFTYKATSHIRGADRFLARFDVDDKYLAQVRASDGTGHTLWAMYNCDHYKIYSVHLPVSGTSSRMVFNNQELSKLALDVWNEGVKLELEEGDSESGNTVEMNADYPNRLYGLVSHQLPIRYNETLIEPFPGVEMDDKCIRIRGGLINITKCFATGVDWDRRAEWLLPPNYRWFGTGQLNVSLTNLVDRPTCPKYLNMIENMFDGDQERVECWQKCLGKILFCPMFLNMNKFLALYGQAGSGKSTLTNLTIHLLGMHDIAVLRGNFGGRFDTSELPGKRLILFPENEDGTNHHFTPEMSTTIKKITGRDMLVCEKKGQQPITARIDAEILIVGNAPPTVEMDEQAFHRRAVFLRADNTIRTPDYGETQKYIEENEMPGILLWALEGAFKLVEDGILKTPEACMEDLNSATLTFNLEKRFVEQMVVEKSSKNVSLSDLEEGFRQWLRYMRINSREPGWGKITAAIREKFGDKYKSVPVKDAKGKSIRMFKGLALGEILY